MTNSHPHIAFHRRWTLEGGTLERLGECAGLVKAFERTPILPEKHRQLMLTSLSKGAQATTAIEGNTLTDDEVEAVAEGKAPEHEKVPALIEQLCDWLRAEFAYPDQSFSQAVIQAIVTHVYIEWIHPFDDGNGRTGRLLEFYILLRAGNPDFASHILSNFYNETRPEYYHRPRKAGQKHIYDQFAVKPYMKKSVFKRKRNLMLAFPHGKLLSPVEAVEFTLELRREYSQLSERTIHRDLADLVGMHLLVREKGRYRANIALLSRQLPRRLNRPPS